MLTNVGQQAALDELLIEMRSEPHLQTVERAQTTFDRLAQPFAENVVLFGAGPLGKTTLRGLHAAGIEPFAFSDNNPRLWGTQIEGIEVFSPEEAIERFANDATFVVTVYNGSAVRQQLLQAGCPRVSHFIPLWWKYPEHFLPDQGVDLPQNLLPHEANIRACFEAVADDASRKVILDQLRWRFWLDSSSMARPLPLADLYFAPDLIAPAPSGEAFVDCGAFDGATVRDFLAHVEGPVSHIYATEPDPHSRDLLKKFVSSLPPEMQQKVTIWPYALGAVRAMVRFSAQGDVTSRVGSGTIEVECRTFDDLPWTVAPTYVKMDIEGTEPEAIRGGKELWRRERPVIVACLYQKSEQLWEIPLLIHSLMPDYRIFLRRYAEDNWETVCYAVPPERLAT